MVPPPNNSAVSCSADPVQGAGDGGTRYYARQPILTASGKAFAYELLFRSAPEEQFRGDGDLATRTMLDNTIVFGLEKLTGGLPAFINCTLEALTTKLVELLPPALTVLEILETLEPTEQLVQACRALKARGFRLALDDFIWKPQWAPLVDIADFIKVDFKQSDRRERLALIDRLKHHSVQRLAEKIETSEEFKLARKEGFTLFQGYYFCRPTLVKKNDIPPNKMVQLELLRDLQCGDFDLLRISKLVEQDAALTYRLLRLVNSPLFAYRRKVRTVETALMVVGEKAFRRIATLAIASALGRDGTPELLRMALVRARFCELAAPLCGLDETEQYLLGLFSLLPAMLRIPMDQALATIELRQQVLDALLGQKTRERSLLCWMEASERGDWSTCHAVEEFHRADEAKLARIAAEAAQWADATLHQTS
ncbi:MAG TPA: HDOD domain-containing protein [Terracidiphilus sp.]|nr:HDOD domain-containing protein [Terracidiphilus sp.]